MPWAVILLCKANQLGGHVPQLGALLVVADLQVLNVVGERTCSGWHAVLKLQQRKLSPALRRLRKPARRGNHQARTSSDTRFSSAPSTLSNQREDLSLSQLQYTPLLFSAGSLTTCGMADSCSASSDGHGTAGGRLAAGGPHTIQEPDMRALQLAKTPCTAAHLRQAAAGLSLADIALGDELLEGREQRAEQADVVAEQASLRNAACSRREHRSWLVGQRAARARQGSVTPQRRCTMPSSGRVLTGVQGCEGHASGVVEALVQLAHGQHVADLRCSTWHQKQVRKAGCGLWRTRRQRRAEAVPHKARGAAGATAVKRHRAAGATVQQLSAPWSPCMPWRHQSRRR